MAKSMRIKTDDQVIVISGKDSGKQGRVIRTEPAKSRVYVEQLNMIKRAQRAIPAEGKKGRDGGIIEKEGPIHVSNVRLLDPKDNKPTRVGMREGKDGKRQRYAKRSGEAF
jgi:large subunit ribosomal protein L24